jgi:hypothetical protein
MQLKKAFGPFLAIIIFATATFAAPGTSGAVQRRTQPNPARPVVVTRSQPNMQEIADIEINASQKRIFVSYPNADLIEVLNFQGNLVGSITVSRPGAMTVAQTGVFALARNSGSVIHINGLTSAVTTVASSLGSPRGLTMTDGTLYTIVEGAPDELTLLSIDPISRVVTIVSTDYAVTHALDTLRDPNPIAGTLMGTSSSYPSGRYDLTSGLLTTNFDSGCVAPLDDGQCIANFGSEAVAFASDPFEVSTRRWVARLGSTSLIGLDASNGLVLMTASRDGSLSVELFEQDEPGKQVRGFTISNVSENTVNGRYVPSRLASDGSLAVVTARVFDGVNLYLLPGIDSDGAQTTVARPAAPRSAAPPSNMPTFASQRSAAPTTRPSAIALRSLDSWTIDMERGYIYATSSVQGAIDVVDLDGFGVTSIRNLAQPRAIALCNGEIYVALFGTGQVVKINSPTWTTTVVAQNVPRVDQLICAGNTLYASGPAHSYGGVAMWRITPTGAVTLPQLSSTYIGIRFARTVRSGPLLANIPSGYIWMDPEVIQAPNIYPRPGSGAQVYQDLVSFNASGTKFLDRGGSVFDNSLFRAARFNLYPATISQTSPGYVAGTVDYRQETIQIFNEDDPLTIVNEFFVNPDYELLDLSFGPGTRALFAALKDKASGEIFIIPTPDILNG